jgi:hypothetical protein
MLTFEASDVTKPVPSLAESYQQSADGKSFTFKLRSGVKFSDNTPLTATDVAFSLNRVRNLKGNPSLLLKRAGLRARDFEPVAASFVLTASLRPHGWSPPPCSSSASPVGRTTCSRAAAGSATRAPPTSPSGRRSAPTPSPPWRPSPSRSSPASPPDPRLPRAAGHATASPRPSGAVCGPRPIWPRRARPAEGLAGLAAAERHRPPPGLGACPSLPGVG